MDNGHKIFTFSCISPLASARVCAYNRGNRKTPHNRKEKKIMAFFEDLSRKVQDVAFAAAEKGKEVAAIASE